MSSRKSQVKGSQNKGIPIRPSSAVTTSTKKKSIKSKRVQSSESESSSSTESSSESESSSSESSSSEEEIVVKKSKKSKAVKSKSKKEKTPKIKEIPSVARDDTLDAANEIRGSIDGIASSIGNIGVTNEILREIAAALHGISDHLQRISEQVHEEKSPTKGDLDELDEVIASTNKLFLVGHVDGVEDDHTSSHVVRCSSVREIAQLAILSDHHDDDVASVE